MSQDNSKCVAYGPARPVALSLVFAAKLSPATQLVVLYGVRLVSGGGDRQIFVWDVATGRTIRKFRGHDGIVNAVRCLPGWVTLLGC